VTIATVEIPRRDHSTARTICDSLKIKIKHAISNRSYEDSEHFVTLYQFERWGNRSEDATQLNTGSHTFFLLLMPSMDLFEHARVSSVLLISRFVMITWSLTQIYRNYCDVS